MARRVLQLPLMPDHWRWVTFEKIAPPNCRRYYRIELHQTQDGWSVITYRGRIGREPRPMLEVCSSFEDAEALAKKRAHHRFLHDYTLTDIGA